MTSRIVKSRKAYDDRLPAGTGEKFRKELISLIGGDDYKSQYLRDELFSKYLDPKVVPPSQRRDAAVNKWLDCEQTNISTNGRLLVHSANFGYATSDKFFRMVRTLVGEILGVRGERPLPMCLLKAVGILQLVPPTNGASTRVKRSPQAAISKLAGEAHTTVDAKPYWDFLVKGTMLESQPTGIVDGSVMFTVDKKSDIDRVACKEPEINMQLQRGAGEFIRRRLRKVGVNLNDQTVNQRLAQQALGLGLATVDLSSASDSITTQLALLCLPFSVWSLLDDLRVKQTRLPEPRNEDHRLAMFSSMGNGFTFELESLLFYAITRVVARLSRVKGRISVYGDDIICSSRLVPRLSRVFHYLGFRVNLKKTHYRGFFRESCGKHYYRGLDVSPFYIRREVSTVSDLILHLNHLLEWDSRDGVGGNYPFFTDINLLEFHERWSKHVPAFLWGGYDVAATNALVTGHKPRKRLLPKKRLIRGVDHDAAMCLWLMIADFQEYRDSLEVMPSQDYGYVVRRNPPPSLGQRNAWCPYGLRNP
jgi:hypothetical protein